MFKRKKKTATIHYRINRFIDQPLTLRIGVINGSPEVLDPKQEVDSNVLVIEVMMEN